MPTQSNRRAIKLRGPEEQFRTVTSQAH